MGLISCATQPTAGIPRNGSAGRRASRPQKSKGAASLFESSTAQVRVVCPGGLAALSLSFLYCSLSLSFYPCLLSLLSHSSLKLTGLSLLLRHKGFEGSPMCWCNRTLHSVGRELAPGAFGQDSDMPKAYPPQCAGGFLPLPTHGCIEPLLHPHDSGYRRIEGAWSFDSLASMACQACYADAQCTGWRSLVSVSLLASVFFAVCSPKVPTKTTNKMDERTYF